MLKNTIKIYRFILKNLFEKYLIYTIKNIHDIKSITFFKNKVKKPFNIFLQSMYTLYLFNKIIFNYNMYITTNFINVQNILLVS